MIEPCGSEDEAEQGEVGRRFANAEAEGVILPPPLSESVPILTELALANTPVVTVAMGKLYPNALNVRIDDYRAAKEMTQYLIELGHRRVALITGDPTHIAATERERGFKAAVIEASLRPQDVSVEQGMFTFRSGLDAAEKLLGRTVPPTAIFASNDDMAAAVVGVAHRQGLEVPRDLTVVGFDDTAPATTVWPELTTIRQPVSAMAAAALELLLADLRHRRSGGGGLSQEMVLDHELIIRSSSGPPKEP